MPTRQPLSEADVLATAQREGLVLIAAPATATGYKGVKKQTTNGSCYMARAGGKHLGSFPSACEAALAYARHMKSTTCAQPAVSATQILACAPVCDAQRGAALDALRTSANPFGFTGVSASGKQLKPFKATIPSSLRAAGSNGYLGCFATAEDAAIAIVGRVGLDAAQTLRASQTTARKKNADFYVPLDAAAEDVLVAQAEAEATAAGLKLVVNEKSASGYNCVQRRVLKRRKQEADGPHCYYYVAYVYRHDHSQMILGTTRTAAEAALIVARHRTLSSAQGAGETLMTMCGDDNESAEAMMQHTTEQTAEDCRRAEQGDYPGDYEGDYM